VPDLSMCAPAPPDSICGAPCDVGNSKGVGKFCTKIDDCVDNPSATICVVAFTPKNRAYFCTLPCSGPSDTTTCGENATCECSGGQCGCTPNHCIKPTDAGTDAM
jgi:hypothetical protein